MMTNGTSKITVVNPGGQPPTLQAMPAMAPRLDNIEGKTVYIVDINWPYTRQFTEELYDVFSKRYTNTKFVFRDKAGAYREDDPTLWAEIKEKGDAMVMAVGH
ncbi:hypothetical protein ACFL7M_07175 [Thermodesulfobacteriota bacterium]